MLFSPTCNAPGRGSAPRKEVWDCARLLTKLRLLTLLLETPLTSCALKSDTATEGIKARVINICEVPSMRWISWCRGWMWLRWNLTISLKVCSTNGSMRRTRPLGAMKLCHQNECICKRARAGSCGHEISLVPSKTLDTYLSSSEVVNTLSRRVGVDVVDSGRPCCYCLNVSDVKVLDSDGFLSPRSVSSLVSGL